MTRRRRCSVTLLASLLALATLSSLPPPAHADAPRIDPTATPAAVEALVLQRSAGGDPEGALALGEAYLARWPHERRAVFMVHELGEILGAQAARTPDATPARADAIDRACAMRRRLSAYLPGPSWVSPDRVDASHLNAVEALFRKDFRRCAADHTNLAESLRTRGEAAGDRALLYRALGQLGHAAREWARYLLLDMEAPDRVETRYRLADAWHQRVRLEAQLGGTPSPDELAAARSAARSALSVALSAGDPAARRTYLPPTAWLVVDLAQLTLDLQHRRHAETQGREGVERRAQVRTTGEGDALRPVKDPLPREVEEAIAARLAYIAHVPPDLDPANNAELYTFQAADHYFVHGHFEEARKLLRKLVPERCGKSELAHKAWDRLLDMAVLEGDIPGSRALASLPCGQTEPGCRYPAPFKHTYSEAYQLLTRADKAPPGPERDRLWRAAADAYRRDLERAPSTDEAPEAAMNGAYAYKQIGAHAEAVPMLQLFLREYGREDVLTVLEKGDPSVRPPRPADPKKHQERAKYLRMASEQLLETHVSMFDLRAAAAMGEAIAENRRFERDNRLVAARNAAILQGFLGEPTAAVRRAHARLSPGARDVAQMDWDLLRPVVARWDERAADTGANRGARRAAMVEVDRFLAAHEHERGVEALVVRAAHAAATLRRAGREPDGAWCRKAVLAFERLSEAPKRAGGERFTHEAELAAECAFAEIDAAIRADLGQGPRRYTGDAAAIARAFAADRLKVERHARRLREFVARFDSKTWTVAARLREASLHDACAAGLDAAGVRAPGREEAWAAAARGYVGALILAKASGVMLPELIDARRRATAIAWLMGEKRMREATRDVVDAANWKGAPGMAIEGGEVLAAPLPAAP